MFGQYQTLTPRITCQPEWTKSAAVGQVDADVMHCTNIVWNIGSSRLASLDNQFCSTRKPGSLLYFTRLIAGGAQLPSSA